MIFKVPSNPNHSMISMSGFSVLRICLHIQGFSRSIIMKAIKDSAKVLICFGTSADGWKDTDQPVLPSLAKTLLGIYLL